MVDKREDKKELCSVCGGVGWIREIKKSSLYQKEVDFYRICECKKKEVIRKKLADFVRKMHSSRKSKDKIKISAEIIGDLDMSKSLFIYGTERDFVYAHLYEGLKKELEKKDLRSTGEIRVVYDDEVRARWFCIGQEDVRLEEEEEYLAALVILELGAVKYKNKAMPDIILEKINSLMGRSIPVWVVFFGEDIGSSELYSEGEDLLNLLRKFRNVHCSKKEDS